MELTDLYPTCVVRDKDGNQYDSIFFGLFQFKNANEEYTVAQVKLRDGSIGRVKPSNVLFKKIDYVIAKDGSRVYLEH
jgi:hypothetical protein